MSNINPTTGSQESFESIKRVNPDGMEYWLARDLAKVLQYSEYRHFLPVIEKAKKACVNSGHNIGDHIEDVIDMVSIGSGAQRPLDTYYLSRYACYLIIQNADPSKEIVALGQTYFAIQTRKQEMAEQELSKLDETQKRLMLRNEMAVHNKRLASAAKDAGVIKPLDYAIFQDNGYKGLYGGMGNKDIQQHKGLKKSQQILDYMGSTELAANLFRATQTEEKLRRDKIKDKQLANKTHNDIGKKIRQTIKEIGGTMPEDLPTEENIKKVEKQESRRLQRKYQQL
jgi:DNA-damage-inducible protein D